MSQKVTWHKPERPGVDRGMVIEAERGEHGYLVLSNAETLEDTRAKYGAENVTVLGEVPVVVDVIRHEIVADWCYTCGSRVRPECEGE